MLTIVAIQRVLEDPFKTWLPGNTIDVEHEYRDFLLKIEEIYQNHYKRVKNE